MAILSGFTTGKARKSAGDITYTRLNGQNIAKAKIMRNPNYKPTEAQLSQRTVMKYFGKCMNALLPFINFAGVPSTYGSRLNAYAKQYKGAILQALCGDSSVCSNIFTNYPDEFSKGLLLGALHDTYKAQFMNIPGGSVQLQVVPAGTTAAATAVVTSSDTTGLEVGDWICYIIASSSTADFENYEIHSHAVEQVDSENIAGDGWNISMGALAGKYLIMLAVIKRGNTILTSCPWTTATLAS